MKKIKFIDSRYNTLFTINDGDTIIIEYPDGEKVERVCKFIDEYHTLVGTNTFHICQFAELMERNGSVVAPKTFLEKEVSFANDDEFVDFVVNDDCDLYNWRTGEYVFHYNDKEAIAVYNLSFDEAQKLARRGEEYWGAYLGAGGKIYDNPNDYAENAYSFTGWLDCRDFDEIIKGE